MSYALSCILRPAVLLLPLVISGCIWPPRDEGPLPPPNPPVFCYETIGRAACYDQPQNGVGDLINAQLPPVIVLTPPAVIVAPATATVLTPAQVEAIPDSTTTIIEPPVVIRNPDPYPEPGDRAAPFTDAPVRLQAPAYR